MEKGGRDRELGFAFVYVFNQIWLQKACEWLWKKWLERFKVFKKGVN